MIMGRDCFWLDSQRWAVSVLMTRQGEAAKGPEPESSLSKK
jgi:hypothetical protein